MKNTKRNLLTTLAVAGIAGAGISVLAEEGPGGRHGGWRGGHGRGPAIERLTETLNLTADQKAKVQPILDQARPQIRAIHEEAMQKRRAVMEEAMAQIRPLLSAEQQKKADELKEKRQNLHQAMKDLHDTQAE